MEAKEKESGVEAKGSSPLARWTAMIKAMNAGELTLTIEELNNEIAVIENQMAFYKARLGEMKAAAFTTGVYQDTEKFWRMTRSSKGLGAAHQQFLRIAAEKRKTKRLDWQESYRAIMISELASRYPSIFHELDLVAKLKMEEKKQNGN